MKWFKDLKIGTKLYICLGIILFGMIGVMVFYTFAAQVTIKTETIILMSLLTGLIVLIAVFLSISVSRSIAKPIRKIVAVVNKFISGETNAELDIRSKDEVGELISVIDNDVRKVFKNTEKIFSVGEKQKNYSDKFVQVVLDNLQKLAQGYLKCDINIDPPDEDTLIVYETYSIFSKNIQMVMDIILRFIGEISGVLGEMSRGNLNVGITSEYNGDFAELKNSINGIVAFLNEALSNIGDAADQVAAGTKLVSDGSQQISHGATEQASSIEQLTDTMTQIAEHIRENAKNANKASELALEAQEQANTGNEQMKGMLNAMEDINESSVNISKIIKVIDDIAFQTNILALNAAVEAARAGVHGKGFAVVAEEVRNLAARSAKAAKETAELIEGSIKKTGAGTKIADGTAAALESIRSGAENEAKFLNEIAAATNDQATAISQVNRGIEQMSLVVQSNSATAQEEAATAQELSAQAEMLKSLVGQFRLKETAGKARAPRNETHNERYADNTIRNSKLISLNESELGKY